MEYDLKQKKISSCISLHSNVTILYWMSELHVDLQLLGPDHLRLIAIFLAHYRRNPEDTNKTKY